MQPEYVSTINQHPTGNTKLPTDFSWKDSRKYVHSTTLVSFLAQSFYKDFQNEPLLFMEAKFTRLITSNGYFNCSIGPSICEQHSTNEASATFLFSGPGIGVTATFIADTSKKIVGIKKSSARVVTRTLEPFTGGADLYFENFEALWEGIIEFVKRIHLLGAASPSQLQPQVLIKSLNTVPLHALLRQKTKTSIEVSATKVERSTDRVRAKYNVVVDHKYSFSTEYVSVFDA